MASERRGEKIGWLGGWGGSFCWLPILGVLWMVKGEVVLGVVALVLTAVSYGLALWLSPWRHPDVRMWKLMLPVLGMALVCVAFAIAAMGDPQASGLSWWSLLLIGPLLTPLFTAGRRSWADGARPPQGS
jgi:hypothetical protein